MTDGPGIIRLIVEWKNYAAGPSGTRGARAVAVERPIRMLTDGEAGADDMSTETDWFEDHGISALISDEVLECEEAFAFERNYRHSLGDGSFMIKRHHGAE